MYSYYVEAIIKTNKITSVTNTARTVARIFINYKYTSEKQLFIHPAVMKPTELTEYIYFAFFSLHNNIKKLSTE